MFENDHHFINCLITEDLDSTRWIGSVSQNLDLKVISILSKEMDFWNKICCKIPLFIIREKSEI